MAGKSKIPFYDITLDGKDLENSVMTLFAELRPEWRRKNIQTKSYTEGFVNNMIRFNISSDEDMEDAIVVRVHGTTFGDIITRDKEAMAMQLGYAAGCAQPVLAVFKNGVAYKYAHGRTLTAADLNDPKVIRSAARKLAQLHMLDVKTVPLVDSEGNEGEFDISGRFEKMLMLMVAQYPEKMKDPKKDEIFQKYKLPRDELSDEINMGIRLMRDLKMNVCLNHGDFHIKNILYNENTEEVVFVDFEMSEFRAEAMDLAALLSSRPMFEVIGVINPEEPGLTREARQMWIRCYTERKYELKGKDVATVPEGVFEMYGVEVAIVEVMNSLGFILFCGAMAENEQFASVDMIQVVPTGRKMWDERKAELPGLIERYKQLKETFKDFE